MAKTKKRTLYILATSKNNVSGPKPWGKPPTTGKKAGKRPYNSGHTGILCPISLKMGALPLCGHRNPVGGIQVSRPALPSVWQTA
jgi:hypothetical protein